MRLALVQAGVLQDAPFKAFAHILLGVNRNRDDLLRARMDELPVATFAGALFDKTGRLELPDQFCPCHWFDSNPPLGYLGYLCAER